MHLPKKPTNKAGISFSSWVWAPIYNCLFTCYYDQLPICLSKKEEKLHQKDSNRIGTSFVIYMHMYECLDHRWLTLMPKKSGIEC